MKRITAEAFWSFAKPASKVLLARAAFPWSSKAIVNFILKHLPGFDGSVGHIEWSWRQPSLRVEHIVFYKRSQGTRPYGFRAKECTFVFRWRDLFQHRWLATLKVESPILHLDAQALSDRSMAPRESQGSFFRDLPFCISHLSFREGEIHLSNVPHQGALELYARHLEGTIQNLTNSLELASTLQAVLHMRGETTGQGQLMAQAYAYPFAGDPAFDLDMEIRGVRLNDFNRLFQNHIGAYVRNGHLDAFAEVAGSRQGYKGYVKPLLENLAVDVVRYRGWLEYAKGKLVQGLSKILKNPETRRIATRIEFEGSWTHVHVGTLAAIGQFLKNAFRTAFRPGLEHTIRFARAWRKQAEIVFYYQRLPRTRLQKIWTLLREAGLRWSNDKASQMSATLSYYATFSLAPLLILVIAVAGLAFGRDAARGQIVDQLAGLVGSQSAEAIQTMIQAAWKPAKGMIASVLSLITLLFGATGVMIELKGSLNKIWRTQPVGGLGTLLTDRVRSLGLILGVGFLMLTSLVVSAAIAALGELVGFLLPVPEVVMHGINLVLGFLIITGLFGLIYKLLPDARVAWHDVWIGAAVTSALFSVGKLIFGLYLGKSGISSAYGAAGSIVVILLWVYYSALILYFGAEFTAVYAESYGSRSARTPCNR